MISDIDLLPGSYGIPGTTRLLVIDAGGAHLRQPADPFPLLDLLITPVPATPTLPKSASNNNPLITAALAAITFLGAAGVAWVASNRPAPTVAAETIASPIKTEWRDLAFAPGWQGYGHDVNGRFLIETWRQKKP